MTTTTKKKVATTAAVRLANSTADAYSWDRYGEAGWLTCTKRLLEHYTVEETECILRSKYMRWAGDYAQNEGAKPSAKYVMLYVEKQKKDVRDMLCDEGISSLPRMPDPTFVLEYVVDGVTKTATTQAKNFVGALAVAKTLGGELISIKKKV